LNSSILLTVATPYYDVDMYVRERKRESEGEREKAREKGRERESEGERERETVCVCVCECLYTYISREFDFSYCSLPLDVDMWWLRLVGSIKLQVSFAKETYEKRLQSAKETYNLINPTDCSHPIYTCVWV